MRLVGLLVSASSIFRSDLADDAVDGDLLGSLERRHRRVGRRPEVTVGDIPSSAPAQFPLSDP
jgi:hypothetical protein